MLIIDLNAWIGSWPVFPVPGQLSSVRGMLVELGVSRMCLAPLDAVWCHNPHLLNDHVFAAGRQHDDIIPVPVIDPTIATWEEELRRVQQDGARLIKLIPAYSGYEMEAALPLMEALAAVHLPVSVQVRLEDPRRHHPLACVADTQPRAIAAVAQRHPELTVVIGGASTAMLLELQEQLRDTPHLYADVSQADGLDAIKRLVDAGLGKKLAFGSHAPLFSPLAGVARILPELDDESALDILHRNAVAILGD